MLNGIITVRWLWFHGPLSAECAHGAVWTGATAQRVNRLGSVSCHMVKQQGTIRGNTFISSLWSAAFHSDGGCTKRTDCVCALMCEWAPVGWLAFLNTCQWLHAGFFLHFHQWLVILVNASYEKMYSLGDYASPCGDYPLSGFSSSGCSSVSLHPGTKLLSVNFSKKRRMWKKPIAKGNGILAAYFTPSDC